MRRGAQVGLLVVAAAFVGVFVFTAAPTSSPASDTTARAAARSFDLRAKGKETPGRARSKGTVRLRWNRRRTRRYAVVRATLNDRCPGDGYGAYLQVRLYYFPNDGSDYAYAHDSAKDIRGCKARSKDVVLRTGPVKDPYQLEVILREKDADTGDIAFNDDAMREYDLNP